MSKYNVLHETIADQIAEDFRYYYNKGYITSRDGNACYKLNNKEIIVTPSGVKKEGLSRTSYVVVDLNGNVISKNEYTPSIETMGHLSALFADIPGKSVSASVHVHPPETVALFSRSSGLESTLEKELNCLWPELFRYTKVGITVPFLEPGSNVLHESIAISFRFDCDIVVLQNHGVLAVGNTLEQCKEHIDRLEHVSKILNLRR